MVLNTNLGQVRKLKIFGVLIGWIIFVTLLTLSRVWEMFTTEDEIYIVNEKKERNKFGLDTPEKIPMEKLKSQTTPSPPPSLEFPARKFELCASIEKFIKNSSVIDFGAGLGLYGRCWLRNYNIPNVKNQTFIESFKKGMQSVSLFDKPQVILSWEGYDKEPNIKYFTKGFVNHLNIEFPFGLTKMFDWVICLDVWQNIDQSSVRFFVNNLYKHALKGVILSWDYSAPETTKRKDRDTILKNIHTNMTRENFFYHDSKSESIIKTSLKDNIYKENLMVYRRNLTA